MDIISKLYNIVSHKTLLAQLDFVEDPEYEIQQLEKEKQSIQNLTQQEEDPIEENNNKQQ